MNMFNNNPKTNYQSKNFDIYMDANEEALLSNEKMLKAVFSKVSNLYYYLNFEEIISNVTQVLPEVNKFSHILLINVISSGLKMKIFIF